MKKLLAYLKGYEKESILGPLFKLLEASFELIGAAGGGGDDRPGHRTGK